MLEFFDIYFDTQTCRFWISNDSSRVFIPILINLFEEKKIRINFENFTNNMIETQIRSFNIFNILGKV